MIGRDDLDAIRSRWPAGRLAKSDARDDVLELLDLVKMLAADLSYAHREMEKARAAFFYGCDDGPDGWTPGETAVDALIRARDERDDARSTIEDLTDEIERGRVAIRLWRADMSDTRAVLERIAAAVGVEVVALAEDASIAIHRSALESCNRARAAAEKECAALRDELRSATICGVELAKALSTTATTVGTLRGAMLDESAALVRAHDDGRCNALDVATRLRDHAKGER